MFGSFHSPAFHTFYTFSHFNRKSKINKFIIFANLVFKEIV